MPRKRARVPAAESARRVNAAAALLAYGFRLPAATRRLARQFEVSERQARRYVERARNGGTVEVPDAKIVFTVKLAAPLVRAIRQHSRRTRQTISGVVAQALGDFLVKMTGRAGGGGATGRTGRRL